MAKSTTDPFKQAIKTYLDAFAENDPAFAEKYESAKKTIDDCVNYIYSQVQKLKRAGMTDDEVYGMAVHFYDEDKIKPGAKINCTVVVNHQVELTDEEKKAAMERGQAKARQEALQKLENDAAETVSLSDEDIAAANELARQQVFEKAIQDQKDKLVKKAEKKKDVPADEVQPSLF